MADFLYCGCNNLKSEYIENTKNMRISRPKKLRQGDLVTVLSPSQQIGSRRNLNRGIHTLEGLGFRVQKSANAEAVYGMYEAGTPEQRIFDLHSAFSNKDNRGIFMSGGGFLANKLLPLLNYDLIDKNPKVFVGFSDGTTLLNAIFAKTGLITFYGFAIEHFFKRSTPYTVDSFSRIVKDGGVYFYPRTQWHVLKKGRASGRLLGGNLLSFVNLLGTPYCPDLKNSILFFEEHDEASEDMENSFTRLINANVLGGNMVQGIILGKFIDVDVTSDSPEIKRLIPPKGFTLHNIIKKLFENYDIPILANVDFGLISTPLTIPIGAGAVMDLTGHKDRPYFKLSDSAVR